MASPDRSSSPLPYEYPRNEPVCTLLTEQDDYRARLRRPRFHWHNRWEEVERLITSRRDRPGVIDSFYYISTPQPIEEIKKKGKFVSKVANLGPLSENRDIEGVFLTASRFKGCLPSLSLHGSRRIRIPINLIAKNKDEWSLYFETAYYTRLSSRSVDQHVRLVLVNRETHREANDWCEANLHQIPLDTNPLLRWKDGKVTCADGEAGDSDVYLHTIVFVVGGISWTVAEDSAVKCDNVKSWRRIQLEMDAEWGVCTKSDQTEVEEVTGKLKELQVQDTVPDLYGNTRLCEKDVSYLMQILCTYASKWRMIGTALRFTPDELSNIEGKPKLFTGAPARYLQELLSQWVQWPTYSHPTGNATIGELETALRSPLVGLGGVAENLRRKLARLQKSVLVASDNIRICQYLQPLEVRDIIRLGQALGLSQPKLKKMQHLPEEMVDAWLRQEDNVLATSGYPTERSLCKALRDIGQYGIAKDIEGIAKDIEEQAPLYGPPDDSEVVKDKYMVGFQDTLKVDEFKGGIQKVEEWMKLKEHSDKGSKMLKIYGQSSVLVFRGFIAKMDKDLLGKVRKMEQVESVEKCTRFRLEAFVTDRGEHVGWGLNRICVREKLNPESNPGYWYKYLEWEDGEKGPTVYVLDSCVLPNGEHVLPNEAEAGDGIKLSARGIKFRVINSTSYRSHGTAVADVIMSANGVARKGELVSVAVDNNIHCDEQQILDGLEKVKEDYDQRYTTSTERSTVILNMSMSRSLKGVQDFLTKEIKDIGEDQKRNIVVVAAAGNGGHQASSGFPGCLDTVFTVAASDIDDKLADYSNYGVAVDIIAPGTHKLRNGVMFEGTSAACAFVSGVMAKVLSHRYFKKVTPQALKHLLISCSTKNVIRIPQEERVKTPNRLLFDFTQLLAELDDNHEVPFPKEKNWDNFFAKLNPGAPLLVEELRRMCQAAADEKIAAARRSLDGMSDVSSCTSEESPDSNDHEGDAGEGSPIPDDIPSDMNNWETFFPWFFLQWPLV